jgi:hypothetical protein
MKLNTILIILVSTITFQSCKNDIEINAPWKETPVVYSFIDINSTYQYIRINKTFQTANNQTPQQAAQISDSLFFGDTLQVYLYNLSTGETIKFYPSTDIPKDAGYFANDKNTLYKAQTIFKDVNGVDSLNLIKVATNYKLEITHKQTGYVCTAITTIIDKAIVMGGVFANYQLNIRLDLPYIKVPFVWDYAANAVIYDALIRYTYSENGTTKFVDEYITQNEPSIVQYRLASAVLNTFLKNYFNVPTMPIYPREIIKVQYIVLSGSPDLKSAIDISNPNLTLLQVKPNYTNIQGGLGLFTSRSTSIKDMPFQDDISKSNLTQGVNGFPQ